MNVIDIIVCVILVFALIKGWSGGILVQIAGIAGILAGFWAATYCSDKVAVALHMESASHQFAFLVTLVIVMIIVILLLKLVDKLLKSVGLSVPLRILGVIFSVGKWVLLFSLILSIYLSTIKTWNIAPSKEVTESIFYKPFKYVEENVFPYITSNVKTYIPAKPVNEEKQINDNNLKSI